MSKICDNNVSVESVQGDPKELKQPYLSFDKRKSFWLKPLLGGSGTGASVEGDLRQLLPN